MTLPTKFGILGLTLGSGAIASYALFVTQPKLVKINKLIDEEFRYLLLDTKDGSENADSALWQNKWDSYKNKNKGNARDHFNLERWNQNGNVNLKDKLRKKCEKLSNSNVENKNSELYKNVTIYCTRDVAIKDQAKREGLNLIDTKNSNGDWTKLAGKTSELTKDFENLGIVASSGKDITADDIKKGCAQAVNKVKGKKTTKKLTILTRKSVPKIKKHNLLWMEH